MADTDRHIRFYRLLPAFLREAEKQGFIRDPRQWSALYHALENAGDPGSLKYSLAPVCCSNPEQQERFYRFFDQWFAAMEQETPEATPADSGVNQTPKKPAEDIPLPPQPGKDNELSPDEPHWWQWAILFVPLVILLTAAAWRLGWAHPLSLFLALLSILLAAWAAWRWKNRKIAVRQERLDRGDTFWDFRLPHRRIVFGPEFKKLARRLRERVPGSTARLDVPKTVRKSARSGGFLSPHFRFGTEMPTCLMLIDRSSDNNHRAALFDAFYLWLKDNEAPVVRYFYRGVPSKLWNEEHPGGISLDMLASQYAGSRLFLLGDGWRLLDPISAEPGAQAQIFRTWKDRVLITPIPFPEWTARERNLESLFVIAPFNAEGLDVIEKHLNPEEPFDWELQRPDSWPEEAIVFDETDLPESLRPHFPDPVMLEWLAALSFYPELNWNLTLFLGDLLAGLYDRPLLTFDNLRQLSRIHWFYNGFIPAHAREALYRLLDPEKARFLHSRIAGHLEAQRSRKGAFLNVERDRLYLQILLHKALAGEADRSEIRQLRSLVKDKKQDFLTARFTNRPKPWEWILPPEFAFLVPKSSDMRAFRQMAFGGWFARLKEAIRNAVSAAPPAPPPGLPDMIPVKGGPFTMGSPKNEKDRFDNETQHPVTLSDFLIGKYPVTQRLWKEIMGNNPPYFKGDDLPVEQVSWDDVQEFLKKLNARYPGHGYRLPTEAEWEYAARGGDLSKGFVYAGSNKIEEVAWYSGNSGSKTHPVGQKKPNELGLYDMSGNVYEWCADWFGDYPSTPQTDPQGPKTGTYRVNRGGSWYRDPRYCRVACRSYWLPVVRFSYLGFRLAASPQ